MSARSTFNFDAEAAQEALVTGAGGGLSRSIAERLARDGFRRRKEGNSRADARCMSRSVERQHHAATQAALRQHPMPLHGAAHRQAHGDPRHECPVLIKLC